MLAGMLVNTYADVAEGILVSDECLEAETVAELAALGVTDENFADVDGHWAKETINKLAKAGIISGKGEGLYEPEGKVTRAEFIKLLTCAVGAYDSETATEQNFCDVDASAWYYTYIEDALAFGILDMGKTGAFLPNGDAKRRDVAIWISKALGIDGVEKSSFADVTDDETSKAVAAGVSEGIIFGYEDMTFRPDNTLTRAEAAVLIFRVMEKYNAQNTVRESENAAKYTKELIEIENNGKNNIIFADSETGKIVLENCTDAVLEVAAGQVIYINPMDGYPDGGAVKVERVEVDGDKVTVDTVAPKLEEIFSEIDIAKRVPVSSEDYLPGSSAPGVTAVPYVGKGTENLLIFEIEGSGRGDLFNGSASFEEHGLTGTIAIDADIVYDILMKENTSPSVKLICESTVTAYLSYSGEVNAENSLKIGSFKVPLYGPLAVVADFYLTCTAEGEFEVKISASHTNRTGLAVKDSKALAIKGNKTTSSAFTANGEGTVKIGPTADMSLALSYLFASVELFDVSLATGIGVSGETAIEHIISSENGDVSYSAYNKAENEEGPVHACDLCIDGDVFTYLDVSCGIDDDFCDLLGIGELRRFEAGDSKTIQKWFYSVAGPEKKKLFGLGTCPYYYEQLTVTENPISCTVYAGDDIVLKAKAGAGESGYEPIAHPIAYKWYNDGKEIPGANSDTLTIQCAGWDNSGHYHCRVYYAELGEELLSAESEPVYVAVKDNEISFTIQPGGNYDIDVNMPFTLEVEAISASGRPCSYQWYHNGKAVSGSTDIKYHITSASVYDGGTYWCVAYIQNADGSIEERQSQSVGVRCTGSVIFNLDVGECRVFPFLYCNEDGIVRRGYFVIKRHLDGPDSIRWVY